MKSICLIYHNLQNECLTNLEFSSPILFSASKILDSDLANFETNSLFFNFNEVKLSLDEALKNKKPIFCLQFASIKVI